MTEFTVPDRVGRPVLGHRLWIVSSQRHSRWLPMGTLLPLNWPRFEMHWPRGERARASCAYGKGHLAPGEGCSCGFYALKALSPLRFVRRSVSLRLRTEEVADSAGRVWLALGLVSLWGKIIEAEEGWRAQFAYPRMIWLMPPIHRLSGTEPEADERASQTMIALLRRFYRQPVLTAPAPFE